MPSVARPPEQSWTLAIAPAVTAGWRVTGFVTAVPRPRVSEWAAAIVSATYESPARFCESTTASPRQPAVSARSAAAAIDRPDEMVRVQSSTSGLYQPRARGLRGGSVKSVPSG